VCESVVGFTKGWTVLVVMAISSADVLWDVPNDSPFEAGDRRLAGWFTTNPRMYIWRPMRTSFAGRIRRRVRVGTFER
jgi:hypothetical protein